MFRLPTDKKSVSYSLSLCISLGTTIVTLVFSKGNWLIRNVCLNPLWKYQFTGRLRQLDWAPLRVSAAIVGKEPPGKPRSTGSGCAEDSTPDALSGAVGRAKIMV